MKEKFMRFMYGRYGVDSFGRFLAGTAFACMILSMLFHNRFLNTLTAFLLIYCYFRIFSKNICKRSAENQSFLNHTAKIRGQFYHWKSTLSQLRTHHIYKCPTCRQKIRIPRGKGKIEITCPKCRSKFIKRS